jgi:hypothetical protein
MQDSRTLHGVLKLVGGQRRLADLMKTSGKKILQAAVEKMDLSGTDEGGEEGANGGPCDPRALIEL